VKSQKKYLVAFIICTYLKHIVSSEHIQYIQIEVIKFKTKNVGENYFLFDTWLG